METKVTVTGKQKIPLQAVWKKAGSHYIIFSKEDLIKGTFFI